VQWRQRQAEPGPEASLGTPLALGDPVQQPDARQPRDQREEPRGDHPFAQDAQQRADQREVERTVLERLQVAVPDVRIGGPALRELDANRRVAVVLESVDERRGAGEGGHRQRNQQRASQSVR